MKADELLLGISESAHKIKRYLAIRGGKKVKVEEKEYSTECKPGYKRVDGKCVKMSPQEQRNRSIAASKSARKSSTQRNRNISMKRRETLID